MTAPKQMEFTFEVRELSDEAADDINNKIYTRLRLNEASDNRQLTTDNRQPTYTPDTVTA